MLSSQLGEGLYVSNDGNAWWVDILNAVVHRRSSTSQDSFNLPEMPSKILDVDDGVLTLATESGLAKFDSKSRSFEITVHGPPASWSGMARSNDGCLLRDGSILVGRMDKSAPAKFTGDVVLYSNGEAIIVHEGIVIPNTFVALEIEGRHGILISDSHSKVTYFARLTATNKLDVEIWSDLSMQRGTPDGGCLSPDGTIYLAMWGGACLLHLTSQAEFIRQIDLEVLQPTSIHVSDDGSEALVTSASVGMSAAQLEQYPTSGQLIAVPLL